MQTDTIVQPHLVDKCALRLPHLFQGDLDYPVTDEKPLYLTYSCGVSKVEAETMESPEEVRDRDGSSFDACLLQPARKLDADLLDEPATQGSNTLEGHFIS